MLLVSKVKEEYTLDMSVDEVKFLLISEVYIASFDSRNKMYRGNISGNNFKIYEARFSKSSPQLPIYASIKGEMRSTSDTKTNVSVVYSPSPYSLILPPIIFLFLLHSGVAKSIAVSLTVYLLVELVRFVDLKLTKEKFEKFLYQSND